MSLVAGHGDGVATAEAAGVAAGGAVVAAARWRPVAFDITASCDPGHQERLAEVMRPVSASVAGWKYLCATFGVGAVAGVRETRGVAVSLGGALVGYLPPSEAETLRFLRGGRIARGLSLPGVAYGTEAAWSVRLDGAPQEAGEDEPRAGGAECPVCRGAHRPLPDELIAWDPPTLWCEIIKEHKRDKRHGEALAVLEKCMRIEEAHLGGVAPWYYEQAAIVHRKRRDRDAEIAVLRRFAAQRHSPGVTPPRLLTRLDTLEAAAGASR